MERLKLAYIVGGAKHSWVHVIQGIWITEGLSGFWKGNILNLLRMVPFKSINFLAYDLFCKDILEKQGKSEVTNLDRLTAGAASGAAATLLCFPLDTVYLNYIAFCVWGFRYELNSYIIAFNRPKRSMSLNMTSV